MSYPAQIIEWIRRLYRTREGRVMPVPWCEEFSFNLNDIFTRLKIVNKEKSRGTLTDEITNITGIFRAHKDCQKPRTVLIQGNPGMGKTTYCRKLAYDWATKQEEWDESFPEMEVLLLLKCHDIKSGKPLMTKFFLKTLTKKLREVSLNSSVKINPRCCCYLMD